MTLIEIVAASLIGMVIILGLASIDSMRTRMQLELRARGERLGEASLAMAHMIKSFQNTDQIFVDAAGNPGKVRLRRPPDAGSTPTPTLDQSSNYIWMQYHLVGNTLQFQENIRGGNCAVDEAFLNMSQFTITQNPDNNGDFNVFQIRLASLATAGSSAATYTTRIVTRVSEAPQLQGLGATETSSTAPACP